MEIQPKQKPTGYEVYFYPCRYKCLDCGVEYKNSGHMTSHLRTHEKFVCCYCNKPFKNRSSLKRHFTVHQGIKIFRCRFKNCNKKFRDKYELSHHEKIVHTLKKDFKCVIPGCGASFKMNSQRNFHMRIHS